MHRILVLEDEASIREFVVINLSKAGFEVVAVDNGEDALRVFEKENGNFDVALLDIMLPGISGIEVCKKLREQSDSIGIIMLTAKSQEADKLSGFTMGADDFVTKPFSTSELLARVTSLCRRVGISGNKSGGDRSDNLTQGEFTLNLRRRWIEKSGVPIELTQMEFQIMEYFFSNPGKAIDRTEILDQVWGKGYFGQEKIVDVNIRRLRVKIEDEPSEPKHIITVWGMGYKWQA